MSLFIVTLPEAQLSIPILPPVFQPLGQFQHVTAPLKSDSHLQTSWPTVIVMIMGRWVKDMGFVS
jgi:hypothetical protein